MAQKLLSPLEKNFNTNGVKVAFRVRFRLYLLEVAPKLPIDLFIAKLFPPYHLS